MVFKDTMNTAGRIFSSTHILGLIGHSFGLFYEHFSVFGLGVKQRVKYTPGIFGVTKRQHILNGFGVKKSWL